MSYANIGSYVGGTSLIDKRRVQGTYTNPVSNTLYSATKDKASLDAALTTLNAAYYTVSRLSWMTENDKIYALRLANDAAGI